MVLYVDTRRVPGTVFHVECIDMARSAIQIHKDAGARRIPKVHLIGDGLRLPVPGERAESGPPRRLLKDIAARQTGTTRTVLHWRPSQLLNRNSTLFSRAH